MKIKVIIALILYLVCAMPAFAQEPTPPVNLPIDFVDVKPYDYKSKPNLIPEIKWFDQKFFTSYLSGAITILAMFDEWGFASKFAIVMIGLMIFFFVLRFILYTGTGQSPSMDLSGAGTTVNNYMSNIETTATPNPTGQTQYNTSSNFQGNARAKGRKYARKLWRRK